MLCQLPEMAIARGIAEGLNGGKVFSIDSSFVRAVITTIIHPITPMRLIQPQPMLFASIWPCSMMQLSGRRPLTLAAPAARLITAGHELAFFAKKG